MDNTPNKDYAAIHGNFIPLKSPEGMFLIPPRHRQRSPRRLRSRSPRRREPGVHLHLSLTDKQMDTLTSTLTKEDRRQGLDTRDHRRAAIHPEPREEREEREDHEDYKLPSSVYSPSPDQSPARSVSPARSTSPVRFASPTRAPPSLSPDTRTSTTGSGGGRSPATNWTNLQGNQASQASQASQTIQTYDIPEEPDTSSSIYSMDDLARMLPHISPLFVKKMEEKEKETSPVREAPKREQSPVKGSPIKGSPIKGSPLRVSIDQSRPGTYKQQEDVLATQAPGHDNIPPSPLEPAFARKGKVLVGRNGWLERTGQPRSPPAKTSSGLGLLDTLKRMAKGRGSSEVTTTTTTTRSVSSSRASAARALRISLDPREQSLLYCELEYLLTGALDAFLDAQFHAGRLDANQYKRVVDAWQRQGRPRVVGFRYDLETQLDLVQRHTPTSALHQSTPVFRFAGPRAADPVATAALLASMKVNARALRVRTFCQPDSAVAKQLLDSQALLELLGASEARQVQLAEVVQFFKVVLERENAAETGGAGEVQRMREARQDVGLFRVSTDKRAERGERGTSEPPPQIPPRLRPSRTEHSLDARTSPRVGTAERAATQRGR